MAQQRIANTTAKPPDIVEEKQIYNGKCMENPAVISVEEAQINVNKNLMDNGGDK